LIRSATKSALALALLLAGSITSAQTPPPAPTPPAPTPPVPQPAAEPAPPPADTALLPMRNAMTYICGDGQLVTLERDEPAGLIRGIRGGETFTLFEQVGRTPPRFVSGSDSVDLDGDVAILRRGKQERQSCQRMPAEPVAGTVWGTLSKLDRMALPPGTRVKVLLVDGARMDAPAIELGSMQISTTGNQVPLHFLIRFDPARTRAPASPLLQARIEDSKGQLLYITDTANQVPNETAPPSPIELRLVRTGGQ
jgi:uncharacterized lipoprotein YbaY